MICGPDMVIELKEDKGVKKVRVCRERAGGFLGL